jgi:arginyl-tRNA synthetase
MRNELEATIRGAVKDLFNLDVSVELSRPEEQFGDFATNVALQISKQLEKNPREIAEQLAELLRNHLGGIINSVSVAGPGFLNLTLSDTALQELVNLAPQKPLDGQTIVAEYSDPNPFKVLHAGHLYTSIIGDAIANLLENAGASVHRVNFGGDVGLHVGITMWAILRDLGGEYPDKLQAIAEDKRSEWMATAYVSGTQAYSDSEQAKAEIVALNKRVYQLHADNDHESAFAHLYWICRQWSYDYFDEFYARIGVSFEKYYPESQTAPIGLETVRSHVSDGVYKESNGAIVFEGEKYGLHTRVFINSAGLPTYEAKDVGLSILKDQDYHFDRSIIITGNEQEQYMRVVLKSIEQFAPKLSAATTHLTHGMVKLSGGVKMSSRKGNFLRAVDVLDAARDANQAQSPQEGEVTTLGAVKYAFLKNRMGGDLVYDPIESVSLEGNSGPYLQYAHARARSILRKDSSQAADHSEPSLSRIDLRTDDAFKPGERSLVRKLSEYSEVLQQATSELMPHLICTYLYELAQTFNRFYEHDRVIADEREALRLQLVGCYSACLKNGLSLLGITAPEQM